MDSSFTLEDVETIGISCPMLKSFTFTNSQTYIVDFSEHAVAIGKTMPNLCHLRLFKLRIENKGLEAILDGCPILESLHLLQCSDFHLQGGLGKRCYDQIKDLILDSYSSESEIDQADYYWDDDNDSSYSRYDIGNYDPFSVFPGDLSDDYVSDPDFY
ncbi:hypothetical protein SASPL_130145 [Salvia splendens]|uniref:F-box/LRR-repeat protein 15/At3g58940/PEG3-like LRR domain-containing protein n=1 Tax=Salvia splendens TaxID=180675 RepID=A0A8X8X8E1_SALSN|nr:putative F-box/LRR-repeat protein 23 [Salvia splendens]KAG6407161.1 hypothetical protein SASPL_130145 [Salvia splendens]